MVNVLSLVALAAGAAATTYTVQVGQGGQDTFTPSTVTAAVGDVVTFKFDSNHDVGSSSFSSPCNGDGNIYSGIMSSGEFSVKINSTDPIWFFCSVNNHCQRGMVGVINAPSSGDTLSSYQSASEKTSSSTPAGSVAGGILGDASLFGSSSSSAASSASTAAASSAATSGGSSAAATSAGSTAASSVAATATGAGSTSSTTSASASAKSSGAASNFQAFGYAGVAAIAAAILA